MKALGAAAMLGLTTGAAGAESTAANTRQAGPFDTNSTGQFTVTVDGIEIGGWERVRIPGNATQIVESRDRSAFGATEYGDLEMERPVQPDDTRIYEWRQLLRQGRIEEARREVVVTLEDGQGNPRIRWTFTEAVVLEYDALELNAGALDETATESITVRFDEMTREHL